MIVLTRSVKDVYDQADIVFDDGSYIRIKQGHQLNTVQLLGIGLDTDHRLVVIPASANQIILRVGMPTTPPPEEG